MARHEPGMIWPTRPLGTFPQQYVRTASRTEIAVTLVSGSAPRERTDGETGITLGAFRLSRHDARMLARRLNECLDATR